MFDLEDVFFRIILSDRFEKILEVVYSIATKILTVAVGTMISTAITVLSLAISSWCYSVGV